MRSNEILDEHSTLRLLLNKHLKGDRPFRDTSVGLTEIIVLKLYRVHRLG